MFACLLSANRLIYNGLKELNVHSQEAELATISSSSISGLLRLDAWLNWAKGMTGTLFHASQKRDSVTNESKMDIRGRRRT